jgi:C4-type Zn-finger protein
MQLACPQCGTREIRVSKSRTLSEYFKGVVGIYQLRCRRCPARWQTSAWSGGDWRYARCPRCYRQELTTWSEQYYHPPRWTTVLLRAGATPYRCAACRCNFASFRACKEKYSWRQRPQAEEVASDTEPVQRPADPAEHDNRQTKRPDGRG